MEKRFEKSLLQNVIEKRSPNSAQFAIKPEGAHAYVEALEYYRIRPIDYY